MFMYQCCQLQSGRFLDEACSSVFHKYLNELVSQEFGGWFKAAHYYHPQVIPEQILEHTRDGGLQ